MDIVSALSPTDGPIARVTALLPWMQERAAALDAEAAFPAAEIAALRDAGILSLPLPVEGGEVSGEVLADQLAAVLVQIGLGNLAVGRILEAHVNARHLIARYGTGAQRSAAERDVGDGQLFALWVTDAPGDPLRMRATNDGIRLSGRKMFCSAAGFATRALVTAADGNGLAQMLVVPLGCGEQVEPLESPLQGMRAAVTGAVDFTGVVIGTGACLGQAGDYLREPDFSAGAWRGSAVALGGLRALIDLAGSQLTQAGRIDSPHQLQRIGEALIAGETSRLWLRQVARIAEDPEADPAQAIAYVGLARIAIETASLDTMRLVQRSLGLSAFRRGNPVERICRDLGTYLRQPAPDDVLTEAAAHFARHAVADWP
jgi:hypothetical protein